MQLLGFAVRPVFPTKGTEFLHFEALCRGLLIFRVRVVPVFALGALERNDFSRHCLPLPRAKRPPGGRLYALFR